VPKYGPRQGQSNRLPVLPAVALFACAHADFRSGAGRPRAARIISLVHPAQHLYLSGSATEIDLSRGTAPANTAALIAGLSHRCLGGGPSPELPLPARPASHLN
jgi:hypothetical protein